ncbi:MAG: DNA-binding transcriptional regulator [Alistipes sp.]|nr:DNA-binding transcriptional regulator [Alistipes sp.]
MIRVLLLIDSASEFDRKLLRGIVRYSKENGPWLFYRLPSYFRWEVDGENKVMEWVQQWKPSAIIGRWGDRQVERLGELNIPIVLQNYRKRSSVYSNITGDYLGTGAMAAEFFARRLFRNYAFFGVRGVVWSDERREGFRREVERRGGNFYLLEVDRPESEIHSEVARWLHDLPKPVALFCCDDAHALVISEACKRENISIPNDIALLGVDNDDLICNISDPPISSIGLEVERGGYTVGQLLHQRILSGSCEPFSVVINPVHIEQRQSTERHNIENPYIGRVVKYIEEHFEAELTIEQLAELIPLSRRSLELKFKEEMRTTIYQYIMSCRIERFTHLLITTDRTLADIAIEAGFRDCNNISRVFKKFKGCTPLEYRLRNRIL